MTGATGHEIGDQRLGASSAMESQDEARRELVLEAFAERAARLGLRAVVMSELARDLGISTKTLYKLFPTKAQLVRALMEDWSREVTHRQRARERSQQSLIGRMAARTDEWLQQNARFAECFWEELEQDFPEAFAIYTRELAVMLERAERDLRGRLRGDIEPDLAIAMLVDSLRAVSSPQLCSRLHLTRRDAVRMAIELWAGGALTDLACEPDS